MSQDELQTTDEITEWLEKSTPHQKAKVASALGLCFCVFWVYNILTGESCNYLGGGFVVTLLEYLCSIRGNWLALIIPAPVIVICLWVLFREKSI